MALEFKTYERSESLNTIGTVMEVVGKQGTLRFVPGTFTRGKRIAVILQRKDGTSAVIACSTRVSAGLRNAKGAGAEGKQMLAALAKLQVSEDAEGRNFIIAPVGASGDEEAFSVESLKAVAVAYEDLI